MSLHSRAPSLFRCLLAGLACAIVLGLGLLAHCPVAHAWLHASNASGEHSRDGANAHSENTAPTADDHFCAITAFARSTDSPAPAPLVIAPPTQFVVAPLPEAEICLSPARHLLPPGRAPPAA